MLSLKIGRSGLLDLSWEAEWFLIMFPTNCEGLEKRKQTFKLFFCCFSFCLLEVSLPQIFQKGQVSLADSLTQSQLGLFQVFQSLKAMVIMKIILFYWGLLHYIADGLLVEGNMYKQCS